VEALGKCWEDTVGNYVCNITIMNPPFGEDGIHWYTTHLDHQEGDVGDG